MNTRKDYMDGKVSHSDYYGEIVAECGVRLTDQSFIDQVREAIKTDPHLNNIPLNRWDSMASSTGPKRKPIRVNMVCRECGSDDILFDAHADWDPILQRHGLVSSSGNQIYCSACDGESRMEVVPYRILPTSMRP